jgi:F-type H+-transporting ATPase subunit b
MIVFALAENSIQLVPDGTLLIHLLVLIGMVGILNGTLFKPINHILEERDKETRGRLMEAQSTLARIDERIALYERGLREARSEGYALLEKERLEALGQREDKVGGVKQEIAELLARERVEMQRQVKAVRESLAVEAREMGAQIVSRILGRGVR